jgi:methyl-accepting chemotaxis protein
MIMESKNVHIIKKIITINIVVPFILFLHNLFFVQLYNPNLPWGVSGRLLYAVKNLFFAGIFFAVDLPAAVFIGLVLMMPVKKALDDPALITKAKKRISQLPVYVFSIYMTGFLSGPIATYLIPTETPEILNSPAIFIPLSVFGGFFAVFFSLVLMDSVLYPVKKMWGMTEQIGKYRDYPITIKMLLTTLSTGFMIWGIAQYIGYFYYVRGASGIDTGNYTLNIFINSLMFIITGIIQVSLLSSTFKNVIQNIRTSLDDIMSGQGDLTRRVNCINMDELGQLTSDFNMFLKYLDSMIGRIKGIMANVETSESTLKTAIDTNHDVFEGFIHSINQIINGVEKEFSQTRNLEQLISDININTIETRNAIEKQIHSVEYVSSSTEEMLSNIVNVTDISRTTNQKIQTILKDINLGKSKLQESINSINLINQSSSDVMTFINTISDISERIKILAINASIEAARAGKTGEGFAVVAQEVRKLSEASSNSVRDIEEKLIHMTERIQEGTSLINTTGTIMEESFSEFEQTMLVMDEITSSMSEQSIGTNTIIESMSELQKYSTTLTDISAAGQSLYKAIEDICNLFIETSSDIYSLAGSQKEKNSSLLEVNQDLTNAYSIMNNGFSELKEMIGKFTSSDNPDETDAVIEEL